MKNYLKTIVLKSALLRNSLKPLWHVYRRITRGYSTIHGMNGRIHYNDIFDPKEKDHYKSVSLESSALIEKALHLSGKKLEDVPNCLLFPSGYGRELRSIALNIAPCKITCCDINNRAVEFCHNEFGTVPLRSSEEFQSITFPLKYSLIWCGSLFTHLPRERFIALFKLLASSIEEDGILVFTTHEEESFNRLEKYEIHQTATTENLISEWKEKGFIFFPYPWTNQYGISISSEVFIKQLNENLNQPLERIFYKCKGWDNHQSVYAYRLRTRR